MKKLFLAFFTSIFSLTTLLYPAVVGLETQAATSVEHHYRQQIKQGLSTNWSGYASLTSLINPASNAVSFVKGDWTVPTLSCSSQTTYSSAWIGIDGYASPSVEQIGTEHECHSGSSSYYSWYEMYPKSMHSITLAIKPGDKMHAEVTYIGSNYFRLSLANTTTGRTYTTLQRARALRSSAEWVAEAPSSYFGVLPLANFGTINFSNSQATFFGHTGPINDSAWQTDPIKMVTNSLTPKATPSDLDSTGQNFSVTWNSN